MQSWKQYALLVISGMAFWQLIHLGTWCTSYAQVHELLQSYCGDNCEGTLFSWLYIYYVHLASLGFELSLCRGSLMIYNIYIWYIHIVYIYYIYNIYIYIFDFQNMQLITYKTIIRFHDILGKPESQ